MSLYDYDLELIAKINANYLPKVREKFSDLWIVVKECDDYDDDCNVNDQIFEVTFVSVSVDELKNIAKFLKSLLD